MCRKLQMVKLWQENQIDAHLFDHAQLGDLLSMASSSIIMFALDLLSSGSCRGSTYLKDVSLEWLDKIRSYPYPLLQIDSWTFLKKMCFGNQRRVVWDEMEGPGQTGQMYSLCLHHYQIIWKIKGISGSKYFLQVSYNRWSEPGDQHCYASVSRWTLQSRHAPTHHSRLRHFTEYIGNTMNTMVTRITLFSLRWQPTTTRHTVQGRAQISSF